MTVTDDPDLQRPESGLAQLSRHLLGLEGGKEGVAKIPAQDFGSIGRVGGHQGLRPHGGGGTHQVHDQDEDAGPGCLPHGPPEDLRVVQVVKEAVGALMEGTGFARFVDRVDIR